MRKALVTVSTDGLRDYVTLPDGQRHILGTVSVLTFVTELTPHIRLARQILDQFLKKGEALFTVDLDKMGELLVSRRARWSSEIPSIRGADRTSTRNTETMADPHAPFDVFQTRLAAMEETVARLDKHASERMVAPKLHVELRQLAGKVASGEPAAPVATPSVDALQSNSTLADEILSTVESTDHKIDQLVTAGRKFNASKARGDLLVIANRVAEILNNVDLAQPWVENDLTQLSEEANKIHSLFAPAKV